MLNQSSEEKLLGVEIIASYPAIRCRGAGNTLLIEVRAIGIGHRENLPRRPVPVLDSGLKTWAGNNGPAVRGRRAGNILEIVLGVRWGDDRPTWPGRCRGSRATRGAECQRQ